MKGRPLALAAASLLAVTGLTACHTNVGAAAFVNGHRISESDIGKYLAPAGVSDQAKAQAAQQGGTINPRSIVTNVLVTEAVFRAVLQSSNSVPTPAQLDASKDAALQTFFGTTQSGGQLDATVASDLTSAGVKPSLLPHFFTSYELEYVLVKTHSLTNVADLSKVVSDAHVKVSVNPAYGQWDAANVSVGSAATPGYLTRQSTYQPPTPTSTPGG